MHSPARTSVRSALAMFGLLAATGCSDAPLSASSADADGGFAAADRAVVDAVIDVIIPSQEISLPAGKYIEIDDISLSDAAGGIGPEGARDTNLCSSSTNFDFDLEDGDACPGTGSLTDNPNFPGPDPDAVDTLGAEADYLDWADLDPDDHILPFLDQDVDPETLHPYPPGSKLPGAAAGDDIFSPGICVDENGSSPKKANFGLTAFAANSTYFYLLNERQASEGNEAYHYFATKAEPDLAITPGECGGDTWLWNLEDGDIHIELSYSSTAGLPSATATIYEWTGGDAVLDAEELIGEIGAGWQVVTEDVAYVAINVASGNKAQPNEDNERDFDGAVLDSGLKVEVALDIEAIFGGGCGLKRTISGISTSSEGGNDDLKDFLSPVTVQTGALVADLTLAESCDEELTYDLSVTLETDGNEVDVTADPDLEIDLVVDCTGTANDKTITPTLAERASGTISIPVTAGASCSVKAEVAGAEGTDLEECSTDVTDSADVFPDVEAVGALDPDCSGSVAYDGKIKVVGVASPTGDLVTTGSGSPDFSVGWAFVLGVGTAAPSSTLDGSITAAASGSSSVSVQGTLTVSDLRGRDTDGDPETADATCPAVTDVETALALRPLSVELLPTTGDGTCEPDGNANVQNVNFNAVVKGGSGNYIVDWTLADDADLDANNLATGTCADIETAQAGTTADVMDADQDYTQACSFDIGTDFCANGRVTLLVTDTNSECGNQTDFIDADRTSSLDVTPNPLP